MRRFVCPWNVKLSNYTNTNTYFIPIKNLLVPVKIESHYISIYLMQFCAPKNVTFPRNENCDFIIKIESDFISHFETAKLNGD